ncbi:MAG: protein kinase [Gemmatimonadaceae bacterium]|nr:protein kinase [Gemmatimonadaceae bacterium]
MNSIQTRLQNALADRYRLDRELGEGGMAKVFLAHDLRHDRRVAIKVLKPELAAVLGAERFVVEIKTTAALQHPHILPLFDSGTADGFLFYVMPFIEGETLRARLDRETQLGVDEALRIARDVGDALDYAHRHGVIHRDIKPENILLHDGRPMVADFGIALAVSAAAGGRMTETGLSLGTPHYMSPEQATADKEISARSDLYSLASVLYEMLAGTPPHTGASAQQIIMKIVTESAEPVTKFRKSVPEHVAAALAKALEKLPADRFDSVHAFTDALADSGFRTTTSPGQPAHGATQARRTQLLTALTVVSVVVGAWGWFRPTPPPPVSRYTVTFPGISSELATNPLPIPAPDGSFLVFRASIAGQPTRAQLWLKRREAARATPIAGTEQSLGFALSPDGTQIVFVVGSRLLRVPVTGGGPVPVGPTNARGPGKVVWRDDGMILYTSTSGRLFPAIVPATGGAGTAVGVPDSLRAIFTSDVPGTKNILFVATTGSINRTDLWAFDANTKRSVLLLRDVGAARAIGNGALVYSQNTRLFAVEFDEKRLTMRGEPVTLADSVPTGLWSFELSRAGMLLLRADAGGELTDPFDMVWIDRRGRITPIDTTWRFSMVTVAGNHGWALSPDEKRVAIGAATGAGDDIWIKQLPTGALSRLTFDIGSDFRPRWALGGNAITYVTSSRTPPGVYLRRADGTGTDSLLSSAALIDEGTLSPDGTWLVARQGSNGSVAGGRDIRIARPGVDSALKPLIVTPSDETSPRISPDGRWIAYQSDETGSNEIFVRSFPNANSVKYQLSTGGGVAPLWSRDGRELFFVSPSHDMMATKVTVAGGALSFSAPVALFRIPEELLQVEYAFYTPWDVAADGRFLMARMRISAGAAGTTVVIAENWLSELKARMKR